MSDSANRQDAIMNNMTLDELREYRARAARQMVEAGNYASTHNQYIKDTIKDLETGHRLSNSQLETLIKNAKPAAGISASELLDFTLGNTDKNRDFIKSIDSKSLQAYLDNVKKASNKFIGGIAPQDVINNSKPIDIERSNKQIFLAADYKRKSDTIYFVTNSGPDSKDANHYVTVRLLDYQGGLVDGRTRTPSVADVGKVVKQGRIRFDCDCGRHRYWYRYLATVGKYNFGVDETRYPTTRNPNLTGLACKHVLRVMNHISSGTMLSKIQSFARADIAKAANQSTSHRASRQQVASEVQAQAEAMNNWNGSLHWAKKVNRAIKAAQKQIDRDNAREAKRRPNQPTQSDRASYTYAKKQLTKPGIPNEFKTIYKTTIDNFESKWGTKWR